MKLLYFCLASLAEFFSESNLFVRFPTDEAKPCLLCQMIKTKIGKSTETILQIVMDFYILEDFLRALPADGREFINLIKLMNWSFLNTSRADA